MFSLTVVCQNVPEAVQYSRNEPVFKALPTTCPKMVYWFTYETLSVEFNSLIYILRSTLTLLDYVVL